MAESNLDPTGESKANGNAGGAKTGASFQVSKDPVVYGESESPVEAIVEGDSHKFEVALAPGEDTDGQLPRLLRTSRPQRSADHR